jgi:hypothetical protein
MEVLKVKVGGSIISNWVQDFFLIKISYLECMFNFRDPGMFYYYFMPY